MKKRRQKAVYW